MKIHIVVASIFSVLLSTATLGNEPDAADGSATDKATEENGAIKLESIFVGDKEQPAISYFIPWQGVGSPDKLYWNVEDKHDQALNKVDRDVMLRSIQLYEGMEMEAPSSPR